MRKRIALAVLVGLLLAAGAAKAFEKQLQFPLAPGNSLRVEMRTGDLRILGSAEPDVRVRIAVKPEHGTPEQVERRLKILFRPGKEALLEIRGLKDLTVVVSIPSETHLRASLLAGDLDVRRVTGDLRVHVSFGDLDVEVPSRAIYRKVLAHVRCGDVHHPFAGPETGWLGKKFAATFAEGRYNLEATVWFGDVKITELESRPQPQASLQ